MAASCSGWTSTNAVSFSASQPSDTSCSPRRFPTLGPAAQLFGQLVLLGFFPPEANWPWIVNAVGANAFPVIAGAIERGGHVAVGIPDCSYAELGPPTNVELVGHVIDMAHTMGREVATAAEAREILGFA